MYEKILLDDEYIQMMEKIGAHHFITDGKWDWEHGLGHALRVSRYVEKILILLKKSKHDIELGMVAALLHDIGLLTGEKEGHAKRSAIYAKAYLCKFSLKEKDQNIILSAIENHSNGKRIDHIISASLLLADKLDVCRKRVENSTIQDEINIEIAKVSRVDIEMSENELFIFYKTKNNFNPQILVSWKKAFTIPLLVSAYLHKKCIFIINHQNFDVESVVAK